MRRTILRSVLLAVSVLAALQAADVGGRWHFVFDTEAGVREANMALEVRGQEVVGKVYEISSEEVSTEVKGTFSGGKLTLEFEYYSADAGYKSVVKIQGTLEGDKITGEWQFDQHSGTFTATRRKAE